MAAWADRLKRRPWVAHLLRAFARFNDRLGFQFGAAITYFSVLAVVPVLMLGFFISGFVLTISRPELLDPIATAIADALGSADPAARGRILSLIETALSNFTAIGVVGVLSALYSGAGWMANLRDGVRAQWRQHLGVPTSTGNFLIRTLLNLLELLGVVLAICVTFGLASLSTALADSVLNWLGIAHISGLAPVLRLLPVVFSIGAGWLLFVYLFTVLPEARKPFKIVRRGALLGAVGLAILQYLTSFLVARFSNSPAALLFGPIIALMIFFNLFSQLILLVAAWIATAGLERPVDDTVKIDETDAVPPVVSDSEVAPPGLITEAVAARSVRVGIRTGYLTGAATGAGLGAAVVLLLSAVGRHRGRAHEE
jgi:membrane protein